MNRVSVSITAMYLALLTTVCAAQSTDSTLLIVSGKDNYWKTGSATVVSSAANVTVNETQKYQKWLGFGGCFNEAGWEALKKVSAADRDLAMRLLFDENDGIGFTWGRIPIGASDYALTRYTLNETKDDTLMTNFSISHDKDYLIPYIKAAQAVKPNILFWGSAWTPPTWMKTGATDAAGYDGGVMRNDPKYLRANALYTARFCEAYKAEGISIKAVYPQNEPGYTQYYPSCGWGKYRKPDNTDVNGTEYLSTYVGTYLGPTIKQRDPETDIWFGCLSNDVHAAEYWNGAKANAAQFIKGAGLQWNNSNLVPTVAGAGYLVMQTEHQCGNYPWLSAKATSPDDANANNFLASMAPNNHAYGQESWGLITKWINAGVNIYCAWNMVLDTKGFNLDISRKWPQNALLAVDTLARTLKVTPTYYVFRHVAQYVDTGAVRLGVQGGNAIAFRNPDGSIITILYNSNSSQAQTTVSVGGKKLQFNIPAIGWATLCVNWKPTSAKRAISNNQFSANGNGLKITCKENGYMIALPSQESGRIELLTATGRVLESKAIPKGCREILLPKQVSHAGLLIVRAAYKDEARTARLFTF
jgi:glucosylceramidase